MPDYRRKVAPYTVIYADAENRKLVVEFAIPGAPTASVDTKILEDSIHLTAPARDIDYATSLALGWPVKPDKGEATYEFGLLRIEVPFKDPMGDAVKVVIKAGGSGTKIKKLQADASVNHRETGARPSREAGVDEPTAIQIETSGKQPIGLPRTTVQKGDTITCPCISAIGQKATASPYFLRKRYNIISHYLQGYKY